MTGTDKNRQKKVSKQQSHIPEDSVLFERIVPLLLGGMGILTVLLILFAAAVLLGFVQF